VNPHDGVGGGFELILIHPRRATPPTTRGASRARATMMEMCAHTIITSRAIAIASPHVVVVVDTAHARKTQKKIRATAFAIRCAPHARDDPRARATTTADDDARTRATNECKEIFSSRIVRRAVLPSRARARGRCDLIIHGTTLSARVSRLPSRVALACRVEYEYVLVAVRLPDHHGLGVGDLAGGDGDGLGDLRGGLGDSRHFWCNVRA